MIIVGKRRQPIMLVLFTLSEMQNIPVAVETAKTINPRIPENENTNKLIKRIVAIEILE